MVENAVKHGVDQQLESVHIDINAFAEASDLVVKVADNGPGITSEPTSGIGMALSNIKSRLARLYDGQARLEIVNNLSRGVTATISLPLPGVLETNG